MMTWNKRGFARTGLAGNQRVLARALADFEMLQFGRAGTADGHGEFLGRFLRPDFGSAGATCSNGTSTRLESLPLSPT